MKIKAYFVTSDDCGYCDVALDALKSVHGEEAWKPAMELVPTSHPVAKSNGVMSTPTLIVINTEENDKKIAHISGADNMTEEFWGKFFTFRKPDATPIPPNPPEVDSNTESESW